MSDLCREQYPLLRDDLSEEEHYSPEYHRRHRPMTYRGRARNNLKGAAAILTRWPEHWSTFLTYWWIGLGMICLTTFIIYNSLFTFSALPTPNTQPTKPRTKVTIMEHISHKNPALPEIYMHVFAEYDKEVDLNKYLPHIEVISNQHSDFRYHLVVVLNDTVIDDNAMSAEHNNEIALNSLWIKEHNNVAAGIKVEYISLSKYMDNSPLRKHWRHLSGPLLEFLLRAVSIWEKGGIAFNPIVLTPLSPYYTAYTEKIRTALKKYESMAKLSFNKNLSSHEKSHKNANKRTQKVNNIRDIIDGLDLDDDHNNLSEQILTEAENKNTVVVTHSGRKLLSTSVDISENKAEHLIPNLNGTINELFNENHGLVQRNISSSQQMQNNNSSTMRLLPSFLEFLFRHKPLQSQDSESTEKEPNDKNIPYDSKTEHLITEQIDKKSNAPNSLHDKAYKDIIYKPIIVPGEDAHAKIDKTIKARNENESDKLSRDEDATRLMIDIKGNFIATGTACHAFLGTMFTNAIHHSQEETVANFIIRELSIFCNGVLSSCMGIDLILF